MLVDTSIPKIIPYTLSMSKAYVFRDNRVDYRIRKLLAQMVSYSMLFVYLYILLALSNNNTSIIDKNDKITDEKEIFIIKELER